MSDSIRAVMIGTSFNQYRITATIGTGGMGEVIPMLLLAFGLTLILTRASAQNRKLIEDVVIDFPESALTQIETNFPGTRDILKSVQFHRITYLSDGLKVKGYL